MSKIPILEAVENGDLDGASDMLDKASESPSKFAEYILGIKPFPYQEEIMESRDRFIVWVSGRQCGKSTTVSILTLWYAVYGRYIDCTEQVKSLVESGKSRGEAIRLSPACRKEFLIIVVSPSDRQSRIIFNTVKDFIEGNPLLIGLVKIERGIPKIQKNLIEFENGSKIIPLPSGKKGATVRGFRPNIIIFDEASFMDDELFEAIIPSGASSGARIIMISTPMGKTGYFWDKWNDPEWSKFHTKSYDNPIIANDEEFTKQVESMTEIAYRREILGEFADYGGTLLSLDGIKKAVEDDSVLSAVDGSTYISVDVAGRGEDSTVIMVGKVVDVGGKKHLYVVDIRELVNAGFSRITDEIQSLYELYSPLSIIVDGTGLGYGLVQNLRDQGLPVVSVNFSSKVKTHLLNRLKILFEKKLIHIPDERTLVNQLRDYTVSETSTGGLKGSGRRHDDYVMALVLLSKAVPVSTGGLQLVGDISDLVKL